MRYLPARKVLCTALSLAVFLLITLPVSAQASVFVVNTTDDLDDGMCDVNHCSLREAINAANANSGPDSIHFDLPGTGGSTNTIVLDSLLPPLTDDATIIDGTTEPDYAGSPVVFIHKSPSAMVLEVGLAIESNNNEIYGLILVGFGTWLDPQNVPFEWAGGAIYVSGSGNLIQNNTLGQGAWWNTIGVRLSGPANSVIGNVISGNGIGIYTNQPNNLIQGNIVGRRRRTGRGQHHFSQSRGWTPGGWA
jgi:CSLREA domain-containing protein